MRQRPNSYRIALYAVLLLVALIAMWWMARMKPAGSDASSASRDYPDIKKSGVLRVLAQYNTQDYYVDGDSTLGFVSELVRMIGKDLHLNTEIILETNWAASLERLRLGTVDVIAQAIPRTSDTDTAQYRFLDPITQGRIYLVRRASDRAAGAHQLLLRGDTIYLPAVAPARLFIAHLSEEIGDSIHTVFDPLYSTEQLAMKVSAGDIRYTICNERERNRLVASFPELDCSMPLSFALFQAWLVRRSSPELADSLNTSIARLRASGAVDRLFERYGL